MDESLPRATAVAVADGRIVAGKRADFTVLEAGPLEVAPMLVKDIPVWGTVFEGRPYPIVKP